MNFPNSSNVSAADYDTASKRLTVHYKSGGSYTYADVPSSHWHDMQKASSVGGYLHQHIKPKYKAERVEKK